MKPKPEIPKKAPEPKAALPSPAPIFRDHHDIRSIKRQIRSRACCEPWTWTRTLPLVPGTPELPIPEGLKSLPPSAQRRWHLSKMAKLTGKSSSSGCTPVSASSPMETNSSPAAAKALNMVPVPAGVFYHLSEILVKATGRTGSRFRISSREGGLEREGPFGTSGWKEADL